MRGASPNAALVIVALAGGLLGAPWLAAPEWAQGSPDGDERRQRPQVHPAPDDPAPDDRATDDPADDDRPTGDPADDDSTRSPERRRPAEDGTYPLDERWRPLEAIVEQRALMGVAGAVALTLGPRVYVADLEQLLQSHPPGSPRFEALLRHERLHALRQEQRGVWPWLSRYLRDVEFMWREEQLGWYEQLTRLQRAGLQVDAEAVADALASYRNLSGPMVSREEALAWVEAVLAGEWEPPADAMPEENPENPEENIEASDPEPPADEAPR